MQLSKYPLKNLCLDTPPVLLGQCQQAISDRDDNHHESCHHFPISSQIRQRASSRRKTNNTNVKKQATSHCERRERLGECNGRCYAKMDPVLRKTVREALLCPCASGANPGGSGGSKRKAACRYPERGGTHQRTRLVMGRTQDSLTVCKKNCHFAC